ncbi:MAG: DeoR/GlpR family DNA-binding transcription regulator [Atribacterota bacterium]
MPRKAGLIAEERRLKILEALRVRQTLTVKELANMFTVSEDTVRQDLRALEKQGLLRRIYGGASRVKTSNVEIPVELREITNREVKEAIGREAAKIIEDGDSVIFDASTTALQVARNIDPAKRVTILTSSLDICVSLARQPNFNIIATGGTLHPLSFSFVGPQAENAVRNYYADKLFLGARAILVDEGYLADVFELEAHLKKVMVTSAQEVILVAESRKFQEVAFFKICEITKLSQIFTDDGLDATIVQKLEDLGVRVTLVPVKSAT